MTRRLEASWERGILTNGPLVRELEEASAERLGVRQVVAVSSCTSGLMLTLSALELRSPVLVPSFTFAASAHAISWNGATPAFVECDPTSFQIDVDDATHRMAGCSALLATHVFGAPCQPERVEHLARRFDAPVVFDAAHAFGARRAGRSVGTFGTAEVFSLTPTKPLVAGEGGLVATADDQLADYVRLGRDYANPGDYDSRFVGLNARLSEMHAALALESLERFDEHLALRRSLAARYRAGLADVPGITPQQVDPRDESTYKDFTVTVDDQVFGLPRDVVVRALSAEGIDTRCYFSPPVHRHTAYAHLPPVELPVTDDVAGRVISLPIFVGLEFENVERVVEVLTDLHTHAEQVHATTTS